VQLKGRLVEQWKENQMEMEMELEMEMEMEMENDEPGKSAWMLW